jgi:hypothetical protein
MSVPTTLLKFWEMVFSIIPDPAPISNAKLPQYSLAHSAKKKLSSAGWYNFYRTYQFH